MAKTSGGLGKGINALFGDIPEVDEENEENSIHTNGYTVMMQPKIKKKWFKKCPTFRETL